MINRLRRLIGVLGALTLTFSMAAASDVDVIVTSGGRDTVAVTQCGETIGWAKSGWGTGVDDEGLAGFFFDLAFDGGPLEPADMPVGGPMLKFAPPDGISGPGGFGGTVVNGMLVDVGGAQNTIKNTADYAPYPIGEVVTGVGQTPIFLVRGPLTVPVEPGTYTLTVSNPRVTVIKQGEDGSGDVWATEPLDVGPGGTLTIIVPRADPPALVSNSGPVCTGDDVTLYGGPDGMTSYRWTGPGGFESTEQSPIISPAVRGTYTLTVTDDNSCIDRATTTVDVVPASCEVWADCNDNSVHDECDLSFHSSGDCNVNATPDECDVATGMSPDCNTNVVPDECELANSPHDCCNTAHGPACSNPIIEACVCAVDPYCCETDWDRICVDLVLLERCGLCVFAEDCNNNNVPDQCDTGSGASLDCNDNGRPDECDQMNQGDFDGDADVDLDDFASLVDCMGGPGSVPNPQLAECSTACLNAFDLNPDADVDLNDLATFQQVFGAR